MRDECWYKGISCDFHGACTSRLERSHRCRHVDLLNDAILCRTVSVFGGHLALRTRQGIGVGWWHHTGRLRWGHFHSHASWLERSCRCRIHSLADSLIRRSLLATRQRHIGHVHLHLSLGSCHWHRHHVAWPRVEVSAGVVGLLLLRLRAFYDVLLLTGVASSLIMLEVLTSAHSATHVVVVAHLIVVEATALVATSPGGRWLVHLGVRHGWLERAAHAHAAHRWYSGSHVVWLSWDEDGAACAHAGSELFDRSIHCRCKAVTRQYSVKLSSRDKCEPARKNFLIERRATFVAFAGGGDWNEYGG